MKFAPTQIFLAIALLFATCKTDPKAKQGDPTTDLTAASTLRIRMEVDAQNLNPFLSTSAYGRYVSQQIFQYLAHTDPVTLELKPMLIKQLPQMTKVADGKYKGMLAYEFEILDEATWDNGSPVTAQDFIFTVKAIVNPYTQTGQWKSFYEHLADLVPDTANPKKFTAYFKSYYILGLETLCQSPVFPKYHYDPQNLSDSTPVADLLNEKKRVAAGTSDPNLKKFADAFADPKFATDPASISGSGPYKLEAFQPGEGVILAKKQNWWGDRLATRYLMLAAYPSKLVYRLVKDEAATETLLRNGELDLAMNLSTEKFLQLKNEQGLAQKFNFFNTDHTAYNLMAFNHRDPRLTDKRVRQALAQAFDYEYFQKDIAQGMAKRLVSPINAIKSYYNSDIAPYQFDLKKSQELLAAAGWKDLDGDGILDKKVGNKILSLKFKMLASTSSVSTKKMAESIKESTRKAGFDFEIVSVDLQALRKTTLEGNFETAIFATATYPGPDDATPSLHSKSIPPAGDNRGAFANKEVDRLLDAIRVEPDMVKRTDLYKKLQVVIHEEVPSIYINSPQARCVTSKRFDAVISANRPGYYENLFKPKNLN